MVSEVCFGHPTCHFWHPQNGQNDLVLCKPRGLKTFFRVGNNFYGKSIPKNSKICWGRVDWSTFGFLWSGGRPSWEIASSGSSQGSVGFCRAAITCHVHLRHFPNLPTVYTRTDCRVQTALAGKTADILLHSTSVLQCMLGKRAGHWSVSDEPSDMLILLLLWSAFSMSLSQVQNLQVIERNFKFYCRCQPSYS